MGYKLAEEALKRNHKVTLISGPTKLIPPKVKKFISIETADDLLKALRKEINGADCLFMCAAVGDFRVRHFYKRKIKRQKRLSLELLQNKDILSEISKHKICNLFVGFSLETEALIKNAYSKLKNKNLDFIVANRLTKYHNPFGNNKLDVYIIDKFKNITRVKAKNKAFIAKVLLDKVEGLWYRKQKFKNQSPKIKITNQNSKI